MAGASEAAAASQGGQLAANLALGVETIAQLQEITFTQYVRMVLPTDGTAFWVKASLLSPTALFNAYGQGLYNSPLILTIPTPTTTVKGSLHYTTTNNQDETEGFAINRVVFTSLTEIEALNTVSPIMMYIGEFDGLRFAFSKRNALYRQANLFHYQGDAIYPAMADLIVDSVAQINPAQVVVSNSLPIWLTLNKFCPMYPSYLVPDNIVPPWCSVHIESASTRALQAAPYLDSVSSHYQLVTERVRLTFYGLRNFNALDFQDYVNQFTLDHDDVMGVMNMPVMRDEKRTQAELNILAMKKSIEYEINYYQTRIRTLALQYIKSCIPTFYFSS